MQTYSHFIITAVLNRREKRRLASASESDTAEASAEHRMDKLPPLRSRLFLLGSIIPDLPLILLTIGFIAFDLSQGGFTPPTPGEPSDSMTQYLFETMFFETWWVKGLHNLFHAPLMDLFYIGLGYWAWTRRQKAWGAGLFWLGLGAMIHTLIDIPVHYDDGPLLLFPFEWNIRFYSPVSYWDPNRYGTEFTIFEHSLILILLVWLTWDWWRHRGKSKNKAETAIP